MPCEYRLTIFKVVFIFHLAYINPCEPSPCGSNSECHVSSDRAVCSCQPGFLGAPPACRPECAVNSDCPANRACIKQKCKDPCINSCGLDARCHVVGHNPICSCPENLPEGDPFIRCYRKSKFLVGGTDIYIHYIVLTRFNN